MRRMLLLLAALAMIVSVGAFAENPDNPISQGDFAVLLASSLNAPVPPGGWTAANATPFLSGLEVGPLSGSWQPSQTLKERDLAHMVRVLGVNVYATDPDADVTWARAREIIRRYKDFFRTLNLKALGADRTTTTHINTGVGGTEAAAPEPASPATP